MREDTKRNSLIKRGEYKRLQYKSHSPSPMKSNSLELYKRKMNDKRKERTIQYLATLSSHFLTLEISCNVMLIYRQNF